MCSLLKYIDVCMKANRKKRFKCNFDHTKAKFYRTFNSIYAKRFAGNSVLITVELLRSCRLHVLLYAVESLVPRTRDINSLNNCLNTTVAKIFRVSFGDNVDFIWQMTGYTSLRTLVCERHRGFFQQIAAVVSVSTINAIVL